MERNMEGQERLCAVVHFLGCYNIWWIGHYFGCCSGCIASSPISRTLKRLDEGRFFSHGFRAKNGVLFCMIRLPKMFVTPRTYMYQGNYLSSNCLDFKDLLGSYKGPRTRHVVVERYWRRKGMRRRTLGESNQIWVLRLGFCLESTTIQRQQCARHFALSRDFSNAKNHQPRQLGSHRSSAKDLEKRGGFLVYRFNRAINGIAIAVAAVCAKYKPVDPVSVVTIRERLLLVQELQKRERFMVQLMNRPKLLCLLD